MKTLIKKRKLKGLPTLEVLRNVVRKNKEIKQIEARAYYYVPHKISSSKEEKIILLSREEFLNDDLLKDHANALKEGWNIGINSRVKLKNGKIAHIPMLDLAPRKSAVSLRKLTARIGKMIKPVFGGGYIIETGKSYHYLGKKVFPDNLFEEFCGRSLIASIVTVTPEGIPNIHEHIADYRYIGYSLVRHFTCMRITTRGDKTFEPRVIAEV